MSDLLDLWLRFAIALGIGLLVGSERERRALDGSGPRQGGMRTFSLCAMLGAISYHLGAAPLVAGAAGALVLLAALGRPRGARGRSALVTQIALLLTLLLGALSMREPVLASGLGVTLAAILLSRSRLHNFAKRILTEAELHDALVLAGAALVVLPLMPDQALGPYQALNPRAIWMVVVLTLGINSAGHIALRVLGPAYGLPLTGLLSGFVSSALTVGAMGHKARHEPALMASAVAGALFSCVSTAIQMGALLGAISPPTLAALALPLLCAGLSAVAYGALFMLRQTRAPTAAPQLDGRAFGLGAALGLAAMLSVVTLVCAALFAWSGRSGLVASVALAGFADAHAPGVALASLVAAAKTPAQQVVLPMLIAMSSNMLTKMVLAAVSGGPAFAWRTVPGLMLSLGAAWLGALASLRAL